MIEKERLEELIEQGATVWRSMCGDIHKIRLDKRYFFCDDNKLCWHTIAKLMPRLFVDFNYLFETKEDAEEYAEFGNITRTERLELPTWASIEKDFDKFTNGSYVLAERDEFSLELKISKPLISQIIIYTEDDDYNWNLSRENYNEARRLCVKLFKGEE